ncbi:hypothetical protein [Pedobacter cryophilus]|uniref:Uncharacterized protein n=1 Tax=Pedobacter cryophilus TaxID=2571271 RepID=A0A4U1CB64_9SPHI|nr:hypothetical protein [Pedobacter cryophilus]TKC00958.1 hypothetical protein FA046_04575 [Pedobacter cryophilus]
MKWALRFFALLDLGCFAFMYDQASTQFQTFLVNEPLTSIEFFSRTLFLLLWLSLLVSAVFLSIPKKTGLIIYYVQLLPRLVFFAFSLGFISLLTYVLSWSWLQSVLMPMIIFAEMLRVYFSVRIQKEMD